MTTTVNGAIPTLSAGDFLRKAREFAGMTQGELAAALQLDMKTIRDHERDVRVPRSERVYAWARATGVDEGWLQWNVDACSQVDMRPDFDLRAGRPDNDRYMDARCPRCGGLLVDDTFCPCGSRRVNDGLTVDRLRGSARCDWTLAA